MEDEVFEAEIMPDSAGNTLNITLAATFAVAVIFLFLGISIGTILELKSVEVEVTFEPPWNKSMMSEEAKLELGFL